MVAADDLVCVTPADRYSVAVENQQGPSRTIPNSTYCVSGYVWRAARPSDLVCVPPESRRREVWNNINSVWRLEDPSATPRAGVSVVGSARTSATTGYVYVYGGGLSPGGSALFCRVDLVYGVKDACDDLGSLPVDWNGYVSGRLTWYGSCTSQPGHSSMIVVLDERNGRVNTAGTTNLINC